MLEEFLKAMFFANLHRAVEKRQHDSKERETRAKKNAAMKQEPIGQYYDEPRGKWVRNDMIWDPKTKSYIFKRKFHDI